MAVSDQFVLCKAALIFAVTRWLLSLALNLLTKSIGVLPPSSCCSISSSPAASLRLLKRSLTLTTYGEMEQRLPEDRHDESCSVCLNSLRKSSHVWELSNCHHVFHKHCLERWLAYDNKLTCPLCRTDVRPLQPEQPSWAVDRMLYLFGDDLLP